MGWTCHISEKDLHFGIHYVVVGVADAIPYYLLRWIIQIITEIDFFQRTFQIDASQCTCYSNTQNIKIRMLIRYGIVCEWKRLPSASVNFFHCSVLLSSAIHCIINLSFQFSNLFRHNFSNITLFWAKKHLAMIRKIEIMNSGFDELPFKLVLFVGSIKFDLSPYY